MTSSFYYSSGQLLIAGEYFVLRGAKAFALPTLSGQSLKVSHLTSQVGVLWESYDVDQNLWFSAHFSDSLHLVETSDVSKAIYAQQFLRQIYIKKPYLFEKPLRLRFHLEFPLNWGLGSSATLIANLSQWSGLDPYLLMEIMGGSGYDVACGLERQPILYDIKKRVQPLPNFDYPFRSQLYFLHLHQKVNSRDSVGKHFANKSFSQEKIEAFSDMALRFTQAQSLDVFSRLLDRYDECTSQEIGLPTVRQTFFPDYPHPMKYLGAWGGDFCLVVMPSPEEKSYFFERGFHTLLPFDRMIYQPTA